MRLRLAQPEPWLALSSSHAPEHPCAGARARGPPCAPRRRNLQHLKMSEIRKYLPLSFQAASAADLMRFCPCKLPFSLLALAILPLPGCFATLQKRRLLLLRLRNARNASRNALCAQLALCREPATKLSACHQMLSRDSYRCCHGIRTATACRTLRIAASLRPYLAIDCRCHAQAPAPITKANLARLGAPIVSPATTYGQSHPCYCCYSRTLG